jgi:CRISPR-associated protein Cas7/Csd2 subtype I-C
MSENKSPPIANRYDFVFLFDIRNGNPNGDPDAGNMPRMDAETGHGLVTDVAIKRKIRNYIAMARGNTPGYDIYMQERAVLNRAHERAYAATGQKSEAKKLPKDEGKARELTAWMCDNFFDIRAVVAPRAGRDIPSRGSRQPIGVSIRAPARGATCCVMRAPTSGQFLRGYELCRSDETT